MSDFVSSFWHWFVLIVTLVSILGLFPLVFKNRGQKVDKPETMGHTWDEDLQEYNNPLPGWWLNMFVITLVFGLVYLLLFPGLGSFAGVLGWTQLDQLERENQQAKNIYGPVFARYASTDIKDLAKDPVAMRTGERLFANYCAVCHGSDARGAIGFPNLRDGDWLWGGKPEQIKESIAKGRGGVMPGWQAALGGEEGVRDVTEYVLSLSGRRHNAAQADAGKTKFQQMCVGCHTPEATGNPMLGAPNLTDRIWLYGGSPKSVMQSIAHGRQGRMPPHEEFLGSDKVHLLAAYVYSLSSEYEHE